MGGPKAKSVGWAVVMLIKGKPYIADFTLSRTRAEAINKWSGYYKPGQTWRKERRTGKVRCSKIDLMETQSPHAPLAKHNPH